MKTIHYPPFLLFVAALVLIAAHTQLTVRQMALRLTGIREGEIQKVLDLETYYSNPLRFEQSKLQLKKEVLTNEIAVLQDVYATFLPGELIGKRIYFNDTSFAIIDNTVTHILITCDDISEVDACLGKSDNYSTGFTKKSIVIRTAMRVPSLNITVSDLLLGLLVILLIIHHIRAGSPIVTYIPDRTAILFISLGVLSLIPAIHLLDSSYFEPDTRKGIIELVQYIEVFGIGFWCCRQLFLNPTIYKRFTVVLSLMSGVVILIGLTEYCAVFSGWTLRGLLDAETIDATFGIRFNSARPWSVGSESSRNILSLYLTLSFPLLILSICKAPKPWARAIGIACSIGALILIGHLHLLVLAIIAGLFVAFTHNASKAPLIYIGSVALVLISICSINPHHGKSLIDSVAFKRAIDTYGLQPMPLKGTSFEGQQAWQQKYLERQVSFNAVAYSPLLGIGIGNYQNAINDFYENTKVPGHDIVKDPVNLMERDSHSLFQVVMVETGFLGVACLGILLLIPLFRCWQAYGTAKPEDRLYLAGIMASAFTIVVASFQFSFMTRGVQLIAITILAAASMGSCMKEIQPKRKRHRNRNHKQRS